MGADHWDEHNGGAARWYVGNIQTCVDLGGMRPPTLYETDETRTSDSDYPNSDIDDGDIDWAESDGVPTSSGATWTATAVKNQSGNNGYWVWGPNSTWTHFGSSIYWTWSSDTENVVCVLP